MSEAQLRGLALLTAMGSGLLATAGGFLGWDWFLNHPRARPVVRLPGREGARLFYILLGGAPIALSAYLLLAYPRKKAASPRTRPSLALDAYLAYSTARVSRMTVTLICPGYSMLSSILRATSRESLAAARSSTSPGLTMSRTSRPAWMA